MAKTGGKKKLVAFRISGKNLKRLELIEAIRKQTREVILNGMIAESYLNLMDKQNGI